MWFMPKKIDSSNPHSVQCNAMYKHIAHESCLKLEHKSRHSGKLDCIYCQGKCMSCTNNSLNNEIFSACTECLRMTCTKCLKGILIKSIVDYIICVLQGICFICLLFLTGSVCVHCFKALDNLTIKTNAKQGL